MGGKPERLLLASASPRRADLLRRMGLRFEVRPTHVEEDDSGREGPERLVVNNARLKARTLAVNEPESLVLGSDTTVALGGQILSKPVDLEDARAMLGLLSGQTHTVFTAVALYWLQGGLEHSFVEESHVTFKTLDPSTIDHYMTMVNPLDKAGAYGIQTGGELIVASIDGSFENVMGLPIQSLAACLQELGFDFRD